MHFAATPMPSPPAHRSLLLALLASAALVMVLGQLDPNAPWPTSGYNNQRTSRTVGRGPAKAFNLTLLWPCANASTRGAPQFSFSQSVYSAPVISSSNLLIFGDESGVLTAMNINNEPATLEWNISTGAAIKSTPSLSVTSVYAVTSSSLLRVNIKTGVED